jgi:glycosyltransferase involved in cell wall biosynthesis
MNYPKISIVIPVYNAAKFLDKCIQSARIQDYPNLEIVVSNNGSTDDSESIISRYAQQDSRIRAYTIAHVPTVKGSRDCAMAKATGEWVIALDADDSLEEGYVTKLWHRQQETGADWVGACMNFVYPDGTPRRCIPNDSFDFSMQISGLEAARRTLRRGWEIGANGALVRKAIFTVNTSVDNPNCKFYTDEYDTRVILSASRKVAFARANYLYLLNPNSEGKAANWGARKYGLQTYAGLIALTAELFGSGSEEYIGAVSGGYCALIAAHQFCKEHREQLTDAIREEYRTYAPQIVQAIAPLHLDWKRFLKYFYVRLRHAQTLARLQR